MATEALSTATPSIQIQPLQLTIHRGSAMLVTNREGWVGGGRTGLFDHDMRYLSTYQMSIDEFTPESLTAEQAAFNSAILSYTNPTFRAGPAIVDRLALVLRITRVLDEGLHECIEITSFARQPISFRLLINLDCSFETMFEVRGLQFAPPRVVHTRYDAQARCVVCSLRDDWFYRCLQYRIVAADSEPRYSPNLLIFPIHLAHDQTWRLETAALMTGHPLGRFSASAVGSLTGASGASILPGQPPRGFAARLDQARVELRQWSEHLARLATPNPVVQRAYDQAVQDLASLRLQKVGDEWYPAAGVPWYNTIFGRDALNTALQCLPIGCPFPRAVLTRLAQLQGTRVNHWNDEEPGKIPHELRVSQLSLMGKIPFNPFYGTVDASLLYVILLWETYCFTGDHTLLEHFLAPMEGCLRWAAEYGDIDGDGFVEYWMRSPHDYHNQAWKDSGKAVVYPDGTIVPDPIAIVEVQGYYYAALRGAAAIYRALGHAAQADATEKRAADLSQTFNDRYWLPDDQYYAFGLDPDKQPIRTIASNPGQLLWTRIVPPDRAALVAERLMAPDMFCGWGVRTLSRHNGAYDPVAYQRGSIWPFDNSLIALGLKRYGHWQKVNRIAEGIFAASGFFAHGRLPELWAGLDRCETAWPVLYPDANVPQAWSAGSIPLLLRAILGLEPDLAHHRLLVQPTLPEWLDELTVRGIPFAGGTADLRFHGQGTDSRVEVLQTTGGIHVEQSTSLLEVSG
ncbi:MAG TPA: glycogen debranching N-terminal domain-containing protein [Chloroflexota bacterium]|nr:glycogen debranching N-terminal domain-containing protein [Chloroflexota bacterium]